MRARILSITVCVFCFVPVSILFVGCGGGDAEQDKFAAGAFPPTLSDTEDHRNSWTREDCRKCHDEGIDDVPKTVHQGMPEHLKEAKCRTCHVFVAGSAARK